MVKIVLHVGTEKTGTTSIQNALSNSYENLVENGYLFPRTLGAPCHIHLTASALRVTSSHPLRQLLNVVPQNKFETFVEKTKKDLTDEIAASNCDTLLLSDEHISAHLVNTTSMKNYRALCDEFGVVSKVVIYLRRQDQFRLSLFSEAVKAGNIRAFDIDNPLAEFKQFPPRFDYLAILDRLSDVFGRDKLEVRLFDRRLLERGNIVDDFCEAVKLPGNILASTDLVDNRSLDARMLRPLAQMTEALIPLQSNQARALHQFMIDIALKKDGRLGIAMAPHHHKRFMEQFNEQNRVIREKYLSGIENVELFDMCWDWGDKGEPSSFYPECTMSWQEFVILFLKQAYRNVKRTPKARGDVEPSIGYDKSNMVPATCPVCGSTYRINIEEEKREGKLCPHCGASGRAQAIGLFVSRLLFGNDGPLVAQVPDFSKSMVGLSDNRVYAEPLSKICDYTNTFYHQEPFLDICDPSSAHIQQYDLVISADVFEHVIGPPSKAFTGAYRLLKPGGHLILTVPFVNNGEYIEHYPGAVGYQSMEDEDGKWIAEIEYATGQKEIDRSAKFHGGPGKTLEMRLFNRDRLTQELVSAGFEDIRFHTDNEPQHGICWGPASRLVTARRPIGGV